MATSRLTRFVGVRYRDSQARRFQGKPDRCYYVTYRARGRFITEKVGWASEGYSAVYASTVRAERLRDARHGELETRDPTFGEVWERFDDWLETGRKHPAGPRRNYRLHLKNDLAHRRLSEISALDLERLHARLAKRGLSPATRKHVLIVVRQVYNKACAWGLYSGANPVRNVKLPRLSNSRERYLSPAEARQLLATLEKTSLDWHDMALLSLTTGLRAGEVFALRWGHVDLAEGLLHVADGKGGEVRKAPMTAEAARMLARRGPRAPAEYVFPSRTGGPISAVASVYRTAVKLCGLNTGIDDPRQRVCFHTLRHTFASWLALDGTPIRTIQELLGHKTLVMTMRYAHLSPDHRAEAVSRLSGRLKG